MTDLDYSRTKLKWNGWGWEGKSFHLGDEDREGHFWSFVQENLNAAQLPSTPSMKWQDVKLPKSKVTAAVEKKLVAILDQDRVKTDAYERIFHAVGKSYRDLLRIRQGIRLAHRTQCSIPRAPMRLWRWSLSRSPRTSRLFPTVGAQCRRWRRGDWRGRA